MCFRPTRVDASRDWGLEVLSMGYVLRLVFVVGFEVFIKFKLFKRQHA